MPSIQGAVLGLATLLCWHGVRTAPDESLRSGVIRAAATGVVLAATVWHNPVPMTYVAPELTNPDFALQLHAPLVLLFAAYGGWRIARVVPGLWWVLGYLAVAVKDSRHQLVQWIRSSTSIDAVFACPPQIGHLFVAGLTGRKCVAVPIGHLNPGVDGEALLADLRRMLDTGDEREFTDLAERHGVDYVFVDVNSQASAHRVRRLVGWPSLRTVFSATDQPSGVL